MELEKLYSFVLLIVTVGMLIGIGVLTTERFGSTTHYNRLAYNDSTTITGNNTRIALDKGNISNTIIWNGTQNIFSNGAAGCIETFNNNGSLRYINDTAACAVVAVPIYVIYDWDDYATETRNAMGSVTSEISGIATNWLGLIVTVSILAIVLFLVVSSFSGARRQ